VISSNSHELNQFVLKLQIAYEVLDCRQIATKPRRNNCEARISLASLGFAWTSKSFLITSRDPKTIRDALSSQAYFAFGSENELRGDPAGLAGAPFVRGIELWKEGAGNS
jgi:hypothetical protein